MGAFAEKKGKHNKNEKLLNNHQVAICCKVFPAGACNSLQGKTLIFFGKLQIVVCRKKQESKQQDFFGEQTIFTIGASQ